MKQPRRMVCMDDALRKSLEALLARLPLREDRRGTIAMEAECLYMEAGHVALSDLPRAKKAGAKAARRELDELAKLSFKLGRHILSMHHDSLEAIRAQKGKARDPLLLVVELRELIDALASAEEAIPQTPASGDLHAKRRARDVTLYAASLFERLTGKQVTRNTKLVRVNAHLHGPKESGEFHQFLADAFRLLGIDAKAAGQIKLLLEKGREKKAS